MAGYNGYSQSNNAIEAEKRGLITATELSKKIKVASSVIKKELDAEEWHHTSCKFNQTNYYYEPALLMAAGFETEEEIDTEELNAARELLVHLRELSKAAKNVMTYENCIVEWLDWSMSNRRNPRPEECKAEGCKVIIKGATATIFLPDGSKFQKRKSTNGFEVYQRLACPVCGKFYRVKIIPCFENRCWRTETCIKYFRGEK